MMIEELISAGEAPVTLSMSMLGLLIIMALFCGGFCTDAFYHLIKWFILKYRNRKYYDPDVSYYTLYKEYRRLKDIENRYMDYLISDKISKEENS